MNSNGGEIRAGWLPNSNLAPSRVNFEEVDLIYVNPPYVRDRD
jgi:hypothetical protein